MSRARAGSALLIVLVMLGMIAVLAAVIGRVVGGTVQTVGAAIAEDRAAVAAEAAVAVAGAIVAASAESGLPADNVVQEIRLAGVAATVTLVNERARIDLNGSDPAVIAGLFRVLGVDGDLAQQLAARVADWRDPDDDAEPGGAELPAYEQAGRPPPRNGPFVHPFELVSVLGVTPTLAARAVPFLTVGNPSGLVDPFVADRTVLMALPGVTERRVEDFIEERALGTTGREVALLQLGVEDDYIGEDEAPGWRADIVATADGDRPRRFQAVVVAGDDRRPYRVLYMLDETVLAPPGG